jgi:hypothetical protein
VVARTTRTCQEPDCDRSVYARGWCGMHHKRWLRTGSPVRGAPPRTCTVGGCDRDAKTRGWCHAHYQRWRRDGDVGADRPLRRAGPCEVDDCDRQRYARGYCGTHDKRLVLTGDVRPEDPIRIVDGQGWENHGYWVVTVPEDERWLTRGEREIAEHRLVMARHLGRSLENDEVVHHVNGDRRDNRIENLELWSTAHPRGQRAPDKVAFALAILARYAPEHLAGSDAHPVEREGSPPGEPDRDPT